MTNDKQKEREKIMADLNTKFDHGGNTKFIECLGDDPDSHNPKFLSTGILELDESLGGGLTKGSIACIYGQEFCGKTGIALSTAKTVTDAGGYVLYINTEGKYPKVLSDLIGVNLTYVDQVSPQGAAEDIIDTVEAFVYNKETGKLRNIYDLIVFDSINNLVPEATLKTLLKDGAAKEGQMARRAKVQTDFLERLLGRGLLRNDAVLLLIAQSRANMDANSSKYFPTILSGAKAVKYDSKQIMSLSKKPTPGPLDKNKRTTVIGHEVHFNIEKNATIGKTAKGMYAVLYGVGVDDSASMVEKAGFWGILTKEGKKWMMILENGNWLFDKIDEVRVRAKQDPEFRGLLRQEIEKGKPKTPPQKKETNYEYGPLQAEVTVDTGEENSTGETE